MAKKKAASKEKQAAAKTKAPAKKAARKTAKQKKKTAAEPSPGPLLFVQFTRDGKNIGRPSLAQPGYNDLTLVWKKDRFIRASWSKNGKRAGLIQVPRGANDVHMKFVIPTPR